MIALRKNMGRPDQVIRFLVGLALIYLGFIDQSLVGDRLYAIFIGIFGIINLASSFFRFCPFYLMANISTNNEKS